MAVTWEWKDKMGTVDYVRDDGESFSCNLYNGNCMMVMLYEYTDDNGAEMYTLMSFFSDKAHAKRMLGLDKTYHYGSNAIDEGFRHPAKFRLDASYKDAREMAKLLIDAKWSHPLTIELYNGGEQ